MASVHHFSGKIHIYIKDKVTFDINMDFTRKVMAGGQIKDPPNSIIYSSALSRDYARIEFLIAALNGLDILVADILNAYLNATFCEKVYFTAGGEFYN